ncbi:MAG: hypothetical protein OXU37_07790 [Thaumarchaeota archaeon]|nr:hypothetical protein [Nitrososphaerota archaeon]
MSTSESTIRAIRGMGYEVPGLQREGECYYLIKDGTGSILRVSMHISGIIARDGPGGHAVNVVAGTSVFTPKKSRHPEKFRPVPPDPMSAVTREDVEYETAADEPGVYVAENGVSMSILPAIAQIRKTSAVTPNGEPVYIVNASPMLKVLAAPRGRASPAAA